MRAALLLLSALAQAAPKPPASGQLPAPLREELARVQALAERAPTFRRLLAENDGIQWRLADLPEGEFLRYEGPEGGRMLVDPAKVKDATEFDFMLAEARELARASQALPWPVVEPELAAIQRQLTFLLEYAFLDNGFSKDLAKRANEQRDHARALRSLETWTRQRLPHLAEIRVPEMPAREADRAALLAALLADGPDRFYAGCERALPLPRETVRVVELEDLEARHGAALKTIRLKQDEAYARVGGDRYPAVVVRAALALEPLGGAARAREAAGLADAEAEELSVRLRRWLKWPSP